MNLLNVNVWKKSGVRDMIFLKVNVWKESEADEPLKGECVEKAQG